MGHPSPVPCHPALSCRVTLLTLSLCQGAGARGFSWECQNPGSQLATAAGRARQGFSHGLQRLGWPRGGSWLPELASVPPPALALPALQQEAKLKCQELKRGFSGSEGEGGEPQLGMAALKLFLCVCIPREGGGFCGAVPGAGSVESIYGSISREGCCPLFFNFSSIMIIIICFSYFHALSSQWNSVGCFQGKEGKHSPLSSSYLVRRYFRQSGFYFCISC